MTWIKVYRTLMDSAVWSDESLVKLWLWCLFKANHKDGLYKGKPVKRGQFITGRNTASDELGVSPSKWYRGMQRLVNLGNIAIEANSEWTMVTVCNYRTYQDSSGANRTASEQRTDSERTAGDTTSGQPVNTIEEGHNAERQNDRTTEAKEKNSEPSKLKFPPWWTQRCSKQFDAWQSIVAEKHFNGVLTQPSLDAALMSRSAWDEERWFKALAFSTEIGSKTLTEDTRDKRRSNGQAKPEPHIKIVSLPTVNPKHLAEQQRLDREAAEKAKTQQ